MASLFAIKQLFPDLAFDPYQNKWQKALIAIQKIALGFNFLKIESISWIVAGSSAYMKWMGFKEYSISSADNWVKYVNIICLTIPVLLTAYEYNLSRNNKAPIQEGTDSEENQHDDCSLNELDH